MSLACACLLAGCTYTFTVKHDVATGDPCCDEAPAVAYVPPARPLVTSSTGGEIPACVLVHNEGGGVVVNGDTTTTGDSKPPPGQQAPPSDIPPDVYEEDVYDPDEDDPDAYDPYGPPERKGWRPPCCRGVPA
jgi:hypothetical protein